VDQLTAPVRTWTAKVFQRSKRTQREVRDKVLQNLYKILVLNVDASGAPEQRHAK
jgi:hypothetical protein